MQKWNQEFQKKRKEYNLTQTKLAAMVGISREHLLRIEKGQKTPSPELQEQLDIILAQCNPERSRRVIFDYVRIRYPCLDVKHIIEDVLGLKMKYMGHADYAFYSYSAHYWIGDVVVMTSLDKEKGILLELKGRGCRQMESYLLGQNRSWCDLFQRSIEDGCSFKRIDLAIDDTIGILNIPALAEKCSRDECISVFRSFKPEIPKKYMVK